MGKDDKYLASMINYKKSLELEIEVLNSSIKNETDNIRFSQRRLKLDKEEMEICKKRLIEADKQMKKQ